MAAQLQLAMDRSAELDAQVTRVLGRADLDEGTAELLRLLAGHKGAANAISIREILRALDVSAVQSRNRKSLNHQFSGEPADWNERTVKASVKDLVERFEIPIGGSRRPPYGYFLILTAEDQAAAARPLRNELKSLSRRLRALSSKQDLARLFGQVQLELDHEDPQITQRGAA